MKKLFFRVPEVISVYILLTVILVNANVKAQLVTNGGFENTPVGSVDSTNIKGWILLVDNTVAKAPDFSVESDTVEQGKRALRVVVNGIGTYQYSIQAVADSIPVIPGMTYEYSVWARAAKSGAQVNFTVGNYAFAEYNAIRPADLTTQWQKYSMQFTVNDTSKYIRAPIHFGYAGDIGDPIYIDNLQIESTAQVEAARKPVIVQAESGKLGSNFAVFKDSSITYVSVQTNFINTGNPGDTSRIITYRVTFPDTGIYDIYARVRVGPNGYNSDSFFYGNGFGVKDATANSDWITVNGLAAAGFADTDAVVRGPGGLGSGIWKWVNLSLNSYQGSPGIMFTLDNPDSLTKTFQIGGRETGLDIDGFAFGKSYLYFTVGELNNDEPGSVTLPVKIYAGPPLASKDSKYVGCAYSPPQAFDFDAYWDQIIPENAGKWGSVEPNRGVMNWSELDSAYDNAKTHGFPFTYHVLVWGQQQPDFMTNSDSLAAMTKEQQLSLIRQWFQAVANRYPDINYLQVVNEPIHTPPAYISALGGSGATGWDWVINAFKMARQIFPTSVKLMINEYNILNSSTDAATYVKIIKLLQADSLIDMIGVQGHSFSILGASNSTITENINTLASTGLPIQITEFDINSSDDQVQLQDYERIFPLLYQNPYVEGITLWGWRPGTFEPDAYLINQDNTERPALKWLRTYLDTVRLVTSAETAEAPPKSFRLFNNYPNPFNPSTEIRYYVPSASRVTLKVYDILGRLVKTLVNTEQSPGQYTVSFDAKDLSSGVYFYRLQADKYAAVKKMLLMK